MPDDEREPSANQEEARRQDDSSRDRRSRPGAAARSRPSYAGEGEGHADVEALFGDPLESGEEEAYRTLVPSSDASARPPRVSSEIRALLDESLARVRNFPVGPGQSSSSEVIVDSHVLDELEQLLGPASRGQRASPAEEARVPDSRRFTTNIPHSASVASFSIESLTPSERDAFDNVGPPRAPSTSTSVGSSALDRAAGRTTVERGDPARVVRHVAVTTRVRTSVTPTAGEPPPRATEGQAGYVHLGARVVERQSVERWSANSALAALGKAVRERATGVLELAANDGSRLRQVVFREGDFVTVVSALDGEAILNMLADRGDVDGRMALERMAAGPSSGRHGAAALIARGFLAPDELWPILRAHAEWLLERALREGGLQGRFEPELGPRLASEPSVFGGSTGVEVFVDVVRRSIDGSSALRHLGSASGRLEVGPCFSLLHEAALDGEEFDGISSSVSNHISWGDSLLDAPLVLALRELAIVSIDEAESQRPNAHLDDDGAIRTRIADRLKLVREADYFELLGLEHGANGHQIRRAFVELRRSFAAQRLLTPTTHDLETDLRLIVEVIEEAYRILSDDRRRSRYLAALSTSAR